MEHHVQCPVCAAMSLAAEDDEAGAYSMQPHFPTSFPRSLPSQPRTRSGASFLLPHASSSDPMASIAHRLLGGPGSFNEETSHALLASLMADFDASRAMHAGSVASGSGHQDMSYEALTHLEDVKLTAPSELLATMPLDMCLKGGDWEDKVRAVALHIA